MQIYGIPLLCYSMKKYYLIAQSEQKKKNGAQIFLFESFSVGNFCVL